LYWGVDYAADVVNVANAYTLAPIEVLRRNANFNSTRTIFTGGSAQIGQLFTCQVSDVPSRLVSIGLEVTDVTPTLYRKGTVYVGHCNGEKEQGSFPYSDAGGAGVVHITRSFFRKPLQAWTPTQIVSIPGSYAGPMSKGAYVVGRLNEIQPPAQGAIKYPNGTSLGSQNDVALLAEPLNATGTETAYFYPISNTGYAGTFFENGAGFTWSDSGFTPFTVVCSGLAEQTVLQIVVKTTVEYFPQATHPFECGLATYSPTYEPDAFRFYHELMRQIPAAVPVNMNAAGDYWRMIVAAARNALNRAIDYSPAVGRLMVQAGGSLGIPELSAAGTAVQIAGSAANRVRGVVLKRKKKASK